MPSVCEVITARIVDKLEAGTVPWHKPRNAETGAPLNLARGHPYSRINIFLLGCRSYALRYSSAHHRHTSPRPLADSRHGTCS